LALIAAIALTACGDDPEADGGQLSVTQVFRPAKPIATEGSAAALTVKQDGETVARVRTDISQVGEPEVLFDRRLNAGTYELEVAHHACYGPTSCFIPGEKSFLRCAREVEIRDGETSELTVRVSSGFLAEKPSTCSIAES
jgi:hypothetical protein